MICEGGSSKETGDRCEVCNGWNVRLNLLYEHVKWILFYLVSLRFMSTVFSIFTIFFVPVVYSCLNQNLKKFSVCKMHIVISKIVISGLCPTQVF